MGVSIITSKGNETGRKIELPNDLFGITPHKHLLYLDVVNIRKNARQGTTKTKEKGEITASTRKIMPQKGKGRARKGSVKSGILRGGGRTFGPTIRNYGGKINKKEKKIANKSALSLKAQKKQIIIIEDFSFEKPSTQQYVATLQQLGIQKEKVLWILPKVDKNIILSARNIAKHKISTYRDINAYDIMNATKLILFETVMPLLQQKFA